MHQSSINARLSCRGRERQYLRTLKPLYYIGTPRCSAYVGPSAHVRRVSLCEHHRFYLIANMTQL